MRRILEMIRKPSLPNLITKGTFSSFGLSSPSVHDDAIVRVCKLPGELPSTWVVQHVSGQALNEVVNPFPCSCGQNMFVPCPRHSLPPPPCLLLSPLSLTNLNSRSFLFFGGEEKKDSKTRRNKPFWKHHFFTTFTVGLQPTQNYWVSRNVLILKRPEESNYWARRLPQRLCRGPATWSENCGRRREASTALSLSLKNIIQFWLRRLCLSIIYWQGRKRERSGEESLFR